MVLLCYPKCSTCAKAELWLKDNGIEYTYRNIKENNPTREELEKWHKESGLPLKRFFNTSGQLYRDMQLSKKLAELSDSEQYKLLSQDGMLVKRPIVVNKHIVIVGFNAQAWHDVLL